MDIPPMNRTSQVTALFEQRKNADFLYEQINIINCFNIR